MFPRAKRLSREAFSGALKSAKRINGPHFTLSLPPEAVGYAVVVGSRVAKSAVARNRLKRRARAVLSRLALPRSAVVFAKPGAKDLSSAEIREELRALLARAR